MSNCPKCGFPSKCAVEEGKSISACWCIGMQLSPSQLEELENKYSGQCLCQDCLEDNAYSKMRILLNARN